MAKVAIIGAAGTMGSYMAHSLYGKVERIFAYDTNLKKMTESLKGVGYNISQTPKAAVQNAEYVVFCVPTDQVKAIMSQTLPDCKPGTVISGVTSRKFPEAEAFDTFKRTNPQSNLELVTLHTMCDPSKTDAHKEILGIINHNASPEAWTRANNIYRQLSDNISVFESIAEHDSMVAHTQINTSRTNLAIASSFARVGCFPWINNNYGSGFDAYKFTLAMRTASQPSHVYQGIQFGSQEGKEIVKKALQAQHHLLELIASDKKKEYRNILESAREFIFGQRKEPILSDQDISLLGTHKQSLPNSDLSYMQYLLSYAELHRNPFGDLKATTPMHRSLLCLLDRLCMTQQFEAALEAPFQFPSLRADDFVFDREITGWSEAILYENKHLYEDKHQAMTAKLDETKVKAEIERSKKVIELCRTRLEEQKLKEKLF